MTDKQPSERARDATRDLAEPEEKEKVTP